MKKIFSILGALASLVAIVSFIIVYIIPFFSPSNVDFIKGEWNSKKALTIIEDKINKFKKEIVSEICPTQGCDLEHSYIAEYPLLFPNKEVLLVIVTSRENGIPCHACGVTAHIFEFEKNNNSWRLINSDISALTGGSWGHLNSDIEVKVIGNNIYGLFLKHSYGMGGSMSETSELYAKLKDDYKLILNINSGHSASPDRIDNGTYEDNWSSSIKIIKTNTPGFFDLVINTNGVVDKKIRNDSVLVKFNSEAYKGNQVPYFLISDCSVLDEDDFRFEYVDALISDFHCENN